MTDFPHSEYDPGASHDANCQHMRYMLEGYRAAVLNPSTDYLNVSFMRPYSPGSARDISWSTGCKQALIDLRVLEAQ